MAAGSDDNQPNYERAWRERTRATLRGCLLPVVTMPILCLVELLFPPRWSPIFVPVWVIGLVLLSLRDARAFECPRCHTPIPTRGGNACEKCGLVVGDPGTSRLLVEPNVVTSRQEARDLALSMIRTSNVQAWWAQPRIDDSLTIERDWGWVFTSAAKPWLRRTNIRHWVLGNQPVVVRKDGFVQYLPNTGTSLADCVAKYEAQNQLTSPS